MDRSTGASVEDWCDYDGYDASSPEQLDREMAEDVAHFIERLLRCELRLEQGSRGEVKLFWKVEDAWKQALPVCVANERP